MESKFAIQQFQANDLVVHFSIFQIVLVLRGGDRGQLQRPHELILLPAPRLHLLPMVAACH